MRLLKNRAEEELENAADKWRAEKRRLHAEIERLESQADTSRLSQLGDTTNLEQQIAERLRKASSEWDTERDRLVGQIAKLQASVADAIERSSNPLRSTQQIRDQFEGKLAEANSQRLEMEAQLLRAKAAWEEEKKSLVNELIKVRRLTPAGVLEVKERYEKLKGRIESVEESRIRELEGQLSDARASILKYHENSMRSAQDLAAASKEAQTLKRTLSEAKEQAAAEEIELIRRQYEAKLQELVKENLNLEQQLQRSGRHFEPETVAPAAPSPNSGSEKSLNLDAIQAEVQRVERDIQAIDSALDDPATSTSAMKQKNSEKAEQEAYLRGILFCLGRKAT
jgi:hypothetical protein